jgi:hypothetical protein
LVEKGEEDENADKRNMCFPIATNQIIVVWKTVEIGEINVFIFF